MMDGLEVQLLAKLGVVLLLIFPTLWTLRRLLGTQTTGGWRKAIEVLETQPLADGQRLYLVRVQGRHLLVGGCKESLTLLTELEAPPEPVAANAPAPATWDQPRRLVAIVAGHLQARLGARPHAGRREAL